jgi:hypothetical protein
MGWSPGLKEEDAAFGFGGEVGQLTGKAGGGVGW